MKLAKKTSRNQKGLILGFFPAVIILISDKINFKDFAELNNRGE
jgi:hypothetical protein